MQAIEWANYMAGTTGLERVARAHEAVGRALQWCGSGGLDTPALLAGLDLLAQARWMHADACARLHA